MIFLLHIVLADFHLFSSKIHPTPQPSLKALEIPNRHGAVPWLTSVHVSSVQCNIIYKTYFLYLIRITYELKRLSLQPQAPTHATLRASARCGGPGTAARSSQRRPLRKRLLDATPKPQATSGAGKAKVHPLKFCISTFPLHLPGVTRQTM